VDGKVNIEYTTYIWQEKDQYIAHAMPLDVMSAGKTVDQAAVENGTLTDVLSEAGYRLEQGQWVSPSWVSIERHSIPLAA
jgi:hypothetical protein